MYASMSASFIRNTLPRTYERTKNVADACNIVTFTELKLVFVNRMALRITTKTGLKMAVKLSRGPRQDIQELRILKLWNKMEATVR